MQDSGSATRFLVGALATWRVTHLLVEEDGPADTVARVKCDYRETLSDLHLAYIERWTDPFARQVRFRSAQSLLVKALNRVCASDAERLSSRQRALLYPLLKESTRMAPRRCR